MCITKYFEIVRDVIAVNIDAIANDRGISRDDAYAEVINHLQNNAGEWRARRKPNIPYDDPLCRIAYLYGIVPANANLIELIFERDPELSDYFDQIHEDNDKVCICAFGGGPGTELLGLTKWIEKRELDYQIELEFLLVDQVNEWIDSWRAINRQIDERFKQEIGRVKNDWPLRISGIFNRVDMTDTASFGNLGTVFNQDIFILSYVVSEVFDDTDQLADFTTAIVRHAPQGAKFLFIDRNEPRWRKAVANLAADAGITLSTVNYTQTNMSADENRTDLGEIYEDVGRDPRVTWNAFWVVGTKE